VLEGIEAIVFRTVGAQPSLWEAVLPEELQRLPEELARVDALLDDPAFFTPFVSFFDPQVGWPSTPMVTYLRLMFLAKVSLVGRPFRIENGVVVALSTPFLCTTIPAAPTPPDQTPPHSAASDFPIG
jgi:hypothetical protein